MIVICRRPRATAQLLQFEMALSQARATVGISEPPQSLCGGGCGHCALIDGCSVSHCAEK